MRRVLCCVASFALSLGVARAEVLTVAESSNYSRTSLYADVLRFISEVQKQSDLVKVRSLGESTEGRMIPLVILSKEGIADSIELNATGKAAVLIMANIHAGEVEGKEASQMLIREIALGHAQELLDRQVVLVIPIFNVDGNDKLGHNRGDDGPEIAGERANGQNLDLNRDYLKLESPEVKGLVHLMNTWDPVLIVDMHTTNGSYHREPVTYSPGLHPNTDSRLTVYMWQRFFPAVAETLRSKYGYDSVPYGNFLDREHPEKGWVNDTYESRYGTNYIGIRNRFAVLNENYSHADFKTRVLSSHGFIRSILEYTSVHLQEMADLARSADQKSTGGCAGEALAIEFQPEKISDLTVKSYGFVKEKIKPEDREKYPPWVGDFIMKKTDELKDYKLPYLARAALTRSIPLPAGYIVLPFHQEVIENLRRHGIRVERTMEPFHAAVESFKVSRIELEKDLYQGRVPIKVQGAYEAREADIPAGSCYIPMKQPLARLAALLLEPNHDDCLLAWGFFNRVIVEQWTNRPMPYPVYRVSTRPPVATISE